MVMNIRQRFSAEETITRILDVAEEHFRRVGYAKTAVADLAEVLGMSSANIYRFFPSKGAINQAICKRLLNESHEIILTIMAGDGSAAIRLRDVLLALNAFNKSRYTAERRMHEMVEVAMEENWAVIQEHMAFLVGCLAKLINEGIAQGELRPQADVMRTALLVKKSCSCILHPMMIAESERMGLDDATQSHALVDFIINALTI
jgi:AcrR family transcriptional regulator